MRSQVSGRSLNLSDGFRFQYQPRRQRKCCCLSVYVLLLPWNVVLWHLRDRNVKVSSPNGYLLCSHMGSIRHFYTLVLHEWYSCNAPSDCILTYSSSGWCQVGSGLQHMCENSFITPNWVSLSACRDLKTASISLFKSYWFKLCHLNARKSKKLLLFLGSLLLTTHVNTMPLRSSLCSRISSEEKHWQIAKQKSSFLQAPPLLPFPL